MPRPLISPAESVLHNWGLLVLWAAVAVRALLPLLLTRSSWVIPSQWIGVALLTAALNVAGCFLPGAPGRAASYLLGTAAWAAALSLVPRYLWPRIEDPSWPLIYACLGVAAGSFVLRSWMKGRWTAQLGGHGWQWMLDWAAERPLYARVHTLKTVRALGWKREEGSRG